ncbi:MAG: glycosyltransferase family 2 protein, partial [Candidatus Saccharimonadales bacterium]
TLTLLLTTLLFSFAFRVERGLRRFRVRRSTSANGDMPSVSVCIPARNETHAMTQCLERVLASDYKKMEVVVFDDESADNTSFLINSFAHAGVRFIPGTALPEGWLGRNHALEVLAREASGTYIIYLNVDTHITPTTISQLVGYAMTEKLEMLSVIPGRNDVWRPNVLFGHLRYFWEIILSRESSPATSGSLWMIKRHTFLDTIGGLISHKSEVEPEERLAAIIGTKAYRCLVSDQQLGVSYEKKWQSQYETSRRLLYPMVGGNWLGGFAALVILALLNIPFLLVLSGLVVGWMTMHSIALVYVVLFSLLYGRYTHAVWRRNWWIGAMSWPVIILQELALFIASMTGYIHGTITWKGRPITSAKLARQSQTTKVL